MRKLPATILVFLFWLPGYSQNVHLPQDIINRLQQQCGHCRKHPGDSLLLLPPATGMYTAGFHNSILALRKEYLDEAYQYILNTLTHLAYSKDSALYQYVYFIKAKVLYYKHLYSEAVNQFRELLDNYATDSVIISNIYANLGEIHLEQGRFTEALDYFNQWQQLFLATAGYTATKSFYQNKALCLFHLKKYRESEELFLNNIEFEEQHNDTTGLAISFMNLANLYYEQYLDDKAIVYFKKALDYAKKAGDVTILKNATLNMAVVDENRRLYVSALDYRKQYEKLQDSIWNRDKIWSLAEQERKYSLQLNDNKIALLEQQALVRKRERNTLLVAAVALLVIAGFVFYAYRLKVKTNRVINRQKTELGQLNQMKDRLFSIVAHDLRSPVYSLKTNLVTLKSELSQNNTEGAGKIAGMIEKTASRTYHLLDNMLYWALNQAGQLFFRKERLSVAAIINQVCYDFAPLAEAKSITLQKNISPAVFINADQNSLKIIIRNLLDNAIKYTPPNGTITLQVYRHDNQCSIRVKDSGIGMDDATLQAVLNDEPAKTQEDTSGNRSTGFGLGLCKTMMEKNNGTLHITSRQGNGTEVTLVLPAVAI